MIILEVKHQNMEKMDTVSGWMNQDIMTNWK